MPERKAIYRTARKQLFKEIRTNDSQYPTENIWNRGSSKGKGPEARHRLSVSLEGQCARCRVKMGKSRMRSNPRETQWPGLREPCGHNKG